MIPADLGSGIPEAKFSRAVAIEGVNDVDVDFAVSELPERVKADGFDKRELRDDLAKAACVRTQSSDGKAAIDPVLVVSDVGMDV